MAQAVQIFHLKTALSFSKAHQRVSVKSSVCEARPKKEAVLLFPVFAFPLKVYYSAIIAFRLITYCLIQRLDYICTIGFLHYGFSTAFQLAYLSRLYDDAPVSRQDEHIKSVRYQTECDDAQNPLTV
jgi:hypothetical protein